MNEQLTWVIPARYVPETPPPAPPMPTFISRYEFIHSARPSTPLVFVRQDAAAIHSAILSWKHDTDFFSSRRGTQLLSDFRTSWSNLLMAGKKPSTFTGNRPEWKGFLEATLQDDQVALADAWKPKPTELFEYVHALLEDGYDLSLSYQAKDKSYTVTLKDVKHDRSTAGYAVSTRDADAASALKLALWKHFNVLVRDWSVLLGTPSKPRRG